MESSNNSTITFGSVFHLLVTLANGQFGSRDALFERVFKSYHEWRSAEMGGSDFRTSPSLISAIIKNDKPLPRKFVFFYAQNNGGALHNDVVQFIGQAIRTGRQEELYLTGIIDLVKKSTNLTQRDKMYILEAAKINTNIVCEIWFRTFYILMLEPVGALRAS